MRAGQLSKSVRPKVRSASPIEMETGDSVEGETEGMEEEEGIGGETLELSEDSEHMKKDSRL
eukprot:4654680-Karenia_brevis.AAC.1